MRSIQTLAKASWEMELPAGNWLRDVDIVSKAETTDNEPSDDDSPMPRTERKSRPDFHRSLQNTAPAPKAPSVDYTPEIYRSLLPPDYAAQVRRMMMVKAAA